MTPRSGRGPTPHGGPNLLAVDTGEGRLTANFGPGVGTGAALDLLLSGSVTTPVASPAVGG